MSIPLTFTVLEITLDVAMLCCRLAWRNDVVFITSNSAYSEDQGYWPASTSRFSELKLL